MSQPRALSNGCRRHGPGLRGSAALGLVLALAACQADPGPAEAPARNVVVFCLDTLRADRLGAYGHSRDTSPNIDALAARGALFEDALALAPWTLPSTATLMTSLEPWRHGAEMQGDPRDLDRVPPAGFRPGVRTLAQIARARGFRTALLSPNPFLEMHLPFGFDLVWTQGQAPAEALTAQALSWIREKPRRRFFVYFQFMDLHQPLQPPEPYFSHFPAGEGGPRGEEHKEWRFQRLEQPASAEFARYRAHKLALYDGALRYVDAQIGVFLRELQALGLEEQTLFVVTSDHGEEFWEHAELERRLGGDPRGIWGIGHGHSLFQEVLHVPLVFAGPRVGRGRRVGCGVSLLDVAPTLLELSGGKVPARMRGRSLALWLGPGAAEEPCPDRPRIAGSVAYGPEAWTVLEGGQKLIVRSDGVELLYDLGSDPQERQDLAREQPEQVARLRVLLADAARLAPDTRSPVPLSPELQERIRALGYLGN